MTETHRPDRRSRPSAAVPRLELAIAGIGLLAAVAAGVVAYRIVGLYGDGPFASGYHRVRDPETGKSLLVQESRTSTGVLRRVIDGRNLSALQMDVDTQGREHTLVHLKGTEITRVDRDMDGDGRPDRWEYYDAERHLVKVGFSVAGDGVLDAWAYRDTDGQIVKIEVSTRRDGAVDRWEFYEKNQLARVEEDGNHDGRVDRWSTYEEGILIRTVVDADHDGRPDSAVAP